MSECHSEESEFKSQLEQPMARLTSWLNYELLDPLSLSEPEG